jgi:hypothetical protein
MGRRIPGNGHVVTSIWFGPDRQSVSLAGSMAIATNPFSPMAAGVHAPATQARGFSGDPGYGVNRYGNDVGALQSFTGAARPIAQPVSMRLGFGAGVSGQPGMPGTGQDGTGLAGLDLGQLRSVGFST